MRQPWLSGGPTSPDAVGPSTGRGQGGLSIALVSVTVVTLAILPAASVQLSTQPSFMPAMLVLVGCFNLLSAVLLLRQYLETGDRVSLRLSWAYVFSLVVLVAYGAAFPHVIGTKPPLALYPSTAAWLWVTWHTGFVVLLAVALARVPRRPRVPTSPEARSSAMWTSLTICCVTAAAFVALASYFGGHLPLLVRGEDFSALTKIVGPVMLPVIGIATVATWLGARSRRGPERWAAIAAVASLCDVVLTLTSLHRYSVGWYAGRTLTIAASAAVLVALLVEFSKVKTQLAGKSERLSAALRRASELERRQQTLLDNMVNGVTLRSPEGELIAANRAAPQLLMLTVDQMAGLAPSDPGWRAIRADGRDWTPIDNPGIDAIRTGIECHDEMIGVSTQAGLARWLCVNTAVVRSENGSPEGVVTTYADMTDSHGDDVRRARERLLSCQRIEGVFLGRSDCLRIMYQPIVELVSGVVIGYEALSRFTSSPPRPPNEWFAEAHAVGLGIALELHALSTALADQHRMPPGTYLSLNVSPQTAMSPDLFDLLVDAPCQRIVLELTEHVGIEDYDVLAQSLDRLRSRGLRIAIDDAGAGYASLRHILNIRPDIIKLDVALTKGIDVDPARQALVVALVSFREEIGAVIVAEGIETQSALNVLIRLGLQCGQGYHLGRPGDLPQLASTAPSMREFERLVRR